MVLGFVLQVFDVGVSVISRTGRGREAGRESVRAASVFSAYQCLSQREVFQPGTGVLAPWRIAGQDESQTAMKDETNICRCYVGRSLRAEKSFV